MKKNILVIGSGGREHAIAWKLSQSPHVDTVFVTPGNGGTEREIGIENIPIEVNETFDLLDFAQGNNIDLTVVGPEVPLALGIVDEFLAYGEPCIGPTKSAAQLETSKTFCKDFLHRHHIPTASYQSFTDPEKAVQYLKTQSFPLVIKADGLAAGKGVVIVSNEQEAINTIHNMLENNHFGQASPRIIIEAFVEGIEVSFMIISDGKNWLPLATSQDHKARYEGDEGPNTGGMGAYSPAPMVTPGLNEAILTTIIEPTLKGMAQEGNPFTGFLYAGLMIDKQGKPQVLEFNCRLGDPETQPLLMRLKSDFYLLLRAVADQQLDQVTLTWDERYALGIVGCAEGYPADYQKGNLITGLKPQSSHANAKVFHSGTEWKDHQLVTSGGRVVCATALGNTLREAQTHAYDLLDKIHWQNKVYRKDIGNKALEWESLNQ